MTRRSDGLWFEFWANTTGNTGADQVTRLHTQWQSSGNAAHYVTTEVNFTTGRLTAWSGTNSDWTKNQALQWTWNPLTNRGTFHIGWWLTWSTTGVPSLSPVVTPAAAGAPTFFGEGSFATTPAPPGALYTVMLGVQNCRAEGFQISQRPNKPATLAETTQAGTWKRTAALDLPINRDGATSPA